MHIVHISQQFYGAHYERVNVDIIADVLARFYHHKMALTEEQNTNRKVFLTIEEARSCQIVWKRVSSSDLLLDDDCLFRLTLPIGLSPLANPWCQILR